ncbi:MAG: hypothetical protein CVU84_10685 [Firmicutes bacterium HGW-Firmicutes-1]|jgi:exopolysaccharide biosynthesis protein|nr:MAG: hypothetical protein CVU84_10685 [Firmicutes bacterium HGW-Firmicutes-1]
MKRRVSILVACVLFILTITTSSFAASSISKDMTVEYSGGKKTVKTVWIDLNDPTIRLDIVCANNKVGTTDSLKDIANLAKDDQTKVLAAINGTYFNAYSDMQPSGTLISEGEVLHVTNSGTVFGIDGGNDFSIVPLSIKIEGSINDSWVWPNNWYAWNINQIFTESSSSVIFTPEYGTKTPVHKMTSIVVDNHIVTKISSGQVNIPSEGFVLVTGDNSQISKFQVGYSADYKITYNENDYDGATTDQPLSWNNIRSGVGAGPLLLKDSKIAVNAKKEGFTEEKITVSKATRSFIGITNKNQLVIGVVDGVTVNEMAEIAKKLGLTDAMCLDGGASSGLLYNDTYLYKPGRDLSNAVVITQLKNAPVRLQLNGKEIYFDKDPYIEASSNRTLVPMRKIFETLGASVSWASDSTITAVKGDITIKLKVDSDIATVNGVEYKLECPAVLRKGRTFVPLRFITEQFGGNVEMKDGIIRLNIY